jgi:hypothetical protein
MGTWYWLRWSGGAVAQENQNSTDSDGKQTKAKAYPLQWAKPTPPPSTEKVHCHDAKDSQHAEHNKTDSELTFGDHSWHIIAYG